MTSLLRNRIRDRGRIHQAVCALAAAAALSVGCATSMTGSMQRVAVASDPPGARVFIGDEQVGVTPAHVELDRRDGDLALRFEKDCYQETVLPVPRRTSKRVLANVLAAGVPLNDYGLGSWLGAMAFHAVLGGITGRRTGAAFTFPDLVRASLEPMPDTTGTEESGGGRASHAAVASESGAGGVETSCYEAFGSGRAVAAAGGVDVRLGHRTRLRFIVDYRRLAVPALEGLEAVLERACDRHLKLARVGVAFVIGI